MAIMKMMPQEIELWYIIPSLRREFSREMAKQGISGVKIAELLGVTPAAVSQYFSKARAVEFTFNPKMKKEIKVSVARILKGDDAVAEIQRIINILRENQNICRFHHLKEDLDPQCDICFK